MSNFTPLQKPGTKTRKFNKFLIIGNLSLVVLIAIIGFTFYNKTLITTQQKAVAPGACACNDSNGNAVGGSCSGGSCDCGPLEVRNDRCSETSGNGEPEDQNNQSSCESGSGGHWCDVWDVNGNQHSFCAPQSAGCQNQAVENGITMQTGGGSTLGTGGWRCIVGQGRDTPYVAGQSCVESNSVETIGNTTVPNCFCGIIQIDNPSGGGTYQSNCGCSQQEQEAISTTTLVGTIIPTPTGIPTSTPIPTLTIVPTTTDISPTVPLTSTPTATPSGPTPTPTIAQLVCATKDCNETTRPCEPGNICIKANDGSNYCSNESLVDACKSNPISSVCCKIQPTSNATPTEIILAKTSISPTTVGKLLETGVVKSFVYLIPAAIMLIGLIL